MASALCGEEEKKDEEEEVSLLEVRPCAHPRSHPSVTHQGPGPAVLAVSGGSGRTSIVAGSCWQARHPGGPHVTNDGGTELQGPLLLGVCGAGQGAVPTLSSPPPRCRLSLPRVRTSGQVSIHPRGAQPARAHSSRGESWGQRSLGWPRVSGGVRSSHAAVPPPFCCGWEVDARSRHRWALLVPTSASLCRKPCPPGRGALHDPGLGQPGSTRCSLGAAGTEGEV